MAYAPYTQLLQTLMHDKKFDQLTKAASLLHPNRDTLCVMEYDGNDVRLFKRDDQVCIMCPYTMDYVQENAIARSIETGDIFEDADDVDRHAEFLQRTMLPCDAMANKNCAQPKKMKIIISGVIGRMNQDGSCELSQTDMDNGAEFIKDILNCKPGKVEDTCDAHLGMHQYEHELGHAHGPMHFKHDSLPLDIRKDIHDLTKEIDDISDDEDLSEYELDDSDFEPLQFDDKDDHDEYDDNEDDDKEHDDDDEDDEEDDEDDEDDENVQEVARTTKRRLRNSLFAALVGAGLLTGTAIAIDGSITVLQVLGIASLTGIITGTTSGGSTSDRLETENEILRLMQEISVLLLDDNTSDNAKKHLMECLKNLYKECGYSARRPFYQYTESQYKKFRKLDESARYMYDHMKKSDVQIPENIIKGFINDMADVFTVITGKSIEEFKSSIGKDKVTSESVQLMQQPKRLKPIGREIISYIPTEIMQVQDTHDQMVLVGYLSSKLERVDFYLNCLDTDNGRYIVPHDRQYLLNMQRELTDLLQRVLRLKPVTKYERIWKPSMGV